MAQLNKGEIFTDVAPGKTVTSTRLNNHVDGAVLLNGAVLDQTEKTITVNGDMVLLGDSAVAASGAPKKVRVENLLPETARQGVQQYQATDTGAANAYAVALSPAATAYTAGMVVRFKAGNANNTASTLNVNALGTKTIKTRAGGDLAANDILAGQVCEAVYDGTYFQLVNALSAGEVTATHATESLRSGLAQYGADTGAADAYVVTLAPAATAYTAGMVLRFKAAFTNTTTSTVNVNALGTKTIKRSNGDDLVAGDIVAGQVVELLYDGVNFQLRTQTFHGWDYSATAGATLTAGVSTFTHGLGAKPSKVRVVLICTTAQSPFAVDDELEAANVALFAGDIRLNWWTNATAIKVAYYQAGNLYTVTGSGTQITLTDGSWKIKVYASL